MSTIIIYCIYIVFVQVHKYVILIHKYVILSMLAELDLHSLVEVTYFSNYTYSGHMALLAGRYSVEEKHHMLV